MLVHAAPCSLHQAAWLHLFVVAGFGVIAIHLASLLTLLPLPQNTGLAVNKVMLIIDGPAPDGEFSGAVKTVVLAPPTRKHWSKFQKGCDCSRYVCVSV